MICALRINICFALTDCYELQRNGITISGVYPLQLPSRKIVNIWCDMEKGNGGWTVVQRRQDGSVNFTRSWDDYAFGFGNPNSEYWLGNENMYWMTNYANYSLRIDLWDWEDNHAYVMYEYFRLNSEKEFYSLKIEGYSGTAGDAMSSYHDNMKFSTIDSDNDEWYLSCAQKDQSGWWFRSCGFASLNGLYVDNGTVDMAPDGLIRGIIWYNWKKIYGYSMKRTEMKIKPMVAVRIDKELEKIKTAGLNEGKYIETTTKDPSEELGSFGEKRKKMEEEEWAKRTLKRISRAMTLEERKALDKILESLKSKTSTHSLSTSTVSSVGTDPANVDSTTIATVDESG